MVEKRKREKVTKPEEATEEEKEMGFVPSEEEEGFLRDRRARLGEEEEVRRNRSERLRSPRRSGNGGGTYKPAIVVGLAVLLIVYLMIGVVGVSKDDFTTNFQNMATAIDGFKADMQKNNDALVAFVNGKIGILTDSITQVSNRLTSVESNIGTAVAQSSAASTKAVEAAGKVEGIVGSVNTLTSNYQSMNTKLDDAIAKFDEAIAQVDDLEAEITSYEERIAELESLWGDGNGGGDGQGAMPFTYSVTVNRDGFPSGDDCEIVMRCRINILNKTNIDIEGIDLEFMVDVSADDSEISATIRPHENLTGWRVDEWGYDYVILKGTNLAIDGKELYSKLMSITITFDDPTDGFISIDDDSIDIQDWSYD